MKNILLLILACTFLGGCKSEEQDSKLTAAQQNALAQFSYSTITAFQTMDVTAIYNRTSRSLPKAVADEIRNCVRTPQRDGTGRQLGVTVNGAQCPIRAQWVSRPSGSSSSTLDLSYQADDEFMRILPIALMTLDGNRSTIPFGAKYKTTVVYRGSARDVTDDVVNFDVNIDKYSTSNQGVLTLDESVYTIKVSFRDFTVNGRVVNNQSFYLNNTEIDRADFEKLFFILK